MFGHALAYEPVTLSFDDDCKISLFVLAKLASV